MGKGNVRIVPPRGYSKGEGITFFRTSSSGSRSKALEDLTYSDFFRGAPSLCASALLNYFSDYSKEVRGSVDSHSRVVANDALRGSVKKHFNCYDFVSYPLIPFLNKAKEVLEVRLAEEKNPFNLSLSELSFSLQR